MRKQLTELATYVGARRLFRKALKRTYNLLADFTTDGAWSDFLREEKRHYNAYQRDRIARTREFEDKHGLRYDDPISRYIEKRADNTYRD